MSYERPHQKWICGHACEGKACRIGPSRWGRCQATFECQPLRDGNRWRCTRAKSDGGPCDTGPLPDGTCCRAIPRCAPVRSLRAKRGLVTRWVCALTVGGLLLAFYGNARWRFIEPPAVSAPHASVAFTDAAKKAGFSASSECAPCHAAGRGGPVTWTRAALFAEAAPVRPEMTHVDQSCLRCHTGHDFHNTKAPFQFACAECHREHTGMPRMPAPADANCAHCHGNPGLMKAAFTVFAGHPEFRKRGDPDTLKFNHEKHLTGDIPLLNGHKLDCTDCHQPDATGTYMQPLTYAASCRACHSLQFDLRNPELEVPHGNAIAVRAYLHSLPTQYADLATKKKLPVEAFVMQQMLQLREQVRAGEDLERQVFLTTAVKGPDGRPKYYGCAYCHEVKASDDDTAPIITAPVIAPRWYTQGRFDHAKHRLTSCEKCHEVRHSRDTRDVLLPTKARCANCHSPAGGVTDACATCHGYHNPAPASVILSEAKNSSR